MDVYRVLRISSVAAVQEHLVGSVRPLFVRIEAAEAVEAVRSRSGRSERSEVAEERSKRSAGSSKVFGKHSVVLEQVVVRGSNLRKKLSKYIIGVNTF